MVKFINNIIILTALLISTALCSCGDVEQDDMTVEGVPVRVRMSVSSVANSLAEIEAINSIRLIILDKDGKIESNQYKNLLTSAAGQTGNSYVDSDFSTSFNFETTTGKKYIYAIANEESITTFSVEGQEITENETLSDALESYGPGSENFKEFINAVYFAPDYTNAIPLSSFYDIEINGDKEINIYLVRVATKIEFNFNNFRNEDVTITRLAIAQTADVNYFIPQVGEKQQYFSGDYWIDWLKKVCDETNDPALNDTDDNNNLVNEKWGWLTDYSLPVNASHSAVDLTGNSIEDYDEEMWTVPASKTDDNLAEAGHLSKGPFYLPESKYPKGSTVQTYKLELDVTDNLDQKRSLSYELPFLKSLFRNTHFVVNMTMYVSTEDIYVELIPWTESEDILFGTVTTN